MTGFSTGDSPTLATKPMLVQVGDETGTTPMQDTAVLTITAVGGNDGRRPLLMGAVAQPGVGFFYGHLDRWAALYDHQGLGKPVRLRDSRGDVLDQNGEVVRDGRVDVLGRYQNGLLVLYYGTQVGRSIASRDDVAAREEYIVDPATFGHFAEACRLTAANERVLSRLVSEISQQRRAVDPNSMVVNVEL